MSVLYLEIIYSRKILELGFDESFIRTWEYYFDYGAAGFKSRAIGDYQVYTHISQLRCQIFFSFSVDISYFGPIDYSSATFELIEPSSPLHS